MLEEVSYCSGFLSQKVTVLLRWLEKFSHAFAWVVTLPLRLLPFLDLIVTPPLRWPGYSICLEAVKPRFGGRR
jgi:hypothetical protein